MKPLPRLYAIADASFGDPVRLAADLFRGGARLVQLRNKKGGARELLEQAERILALAPPDARVIVNDRLDVALVAGAAGVHLGQTDLPAVEARRILGPHRLIGLSTHNLEQALHADSQPGDYVAVGPVFATATKENPDPVIGLEGLRTICKAIRKPVVAIGGIRMEHVKEVLDAGASSIAVIRSILDTQNVESRVCRWTELLEKNGEVPGPVRSF